eukprot:PhM_4_TR3433/c0_g1_i1/m.86180
MLRRCCFTGPLVATPFIAVSCSSSSLITVQRSFASNRGNTTKIPSNNIANRSSKDLHAEGMTLLREAKRLDRLRREFIQPMSNIDKELDRETKLSVLRVRERTRNERAAQNLLHRQEVQKKKEKRLIEQHARLYSKKNGRADMIYVADMMSLQEKAKAENGNVKSQKETLEEIQRLRKQFVLLPPSERQVYIDRAAANRKLRSSTQKEANIAKTNDYAMYVRERYEPVSASIPVPSGVNGKKKHLILVTKHISDEWKTMDKELKSEYNKRYSAVRNEMIKKISDSNAQRNVLRSRS